MTRLSDWVGSLLLRSLDGIPAGRLMVNGNRLAAVQGEDVVSRSRVRGRVVTSSRSRRSSSSFSMAHEDEGLSLRTGRRRSASHSAHRIRRSDIKNANCHAEEDEPHDGDHTFTWSPLPARRPPAGDVCLALFCDDTWADIEQFGTLPATGIETPTHCRRRKGKGVCPTEDGTRHGPQRGLKNEVADKEAQASFMHFDTDEGQFGWGLGNSPLCETGSSRPLTNPRDTPTRHAPLLQSPVRKMGDVGKDDLTLESLHDLEWLERMDPNDQMILEVHIIWSILTLMVVLLACYSIQHHTL